MILLHGTGDNAHIWDYFAYYTSIDFRIIALDQRGHGNSQWAIPPAYSCIDYVNDLDRLIETLQFNGIVLMGHSLGALHATMYAATRPEKVSGLIHIDIEPCPPTWNKKYLHDLYENLSPYYSSNTEFIEEVKKNSPYADKEMLSDIALFALYKKEDGKFYRKYDREVLYHFDRYDLRPCLAKITCPTLIIRGEESRVMRQEIAEEMRGAIKKSRLVEIPRATHPVHTDNPPKFQEAVLDFLSDSGLINRERIF